MNSIFLLFYGDGSYKKYESTFFLYLPFWNTNFMSRLETRTKESIIIASSLVFKLKCVMKVMDVKYLYTATSTGLASLKKDSSNSNDGGTRKMVNYA